VRRFEDKNVGPLTITGPLGSANERLEVTGVLPWPMTALRFYTALCGSIGLPIHFN
jgi:hypothetical protein